MSLIKVYYKSMSSPRALLAVLRFPGVDTRYHDPSGTLWVRAKYHANPHSTEKDTLPIVFLISKQVVPYWTHGGSC
jgi:hypothetical protein